MLKSAGLFYEGPASLERIKYSKPALNVKEQIEFL